MFSCTGVDSLKIWRGGAGCDDGEIQTMLIVPRDSGRQGDGDDRRCHNGWISMRELWGSGDGETCKEEGSCGS